MIQTKQIKPLPENIFKQLGWDFFLPQYIGEYIMPELLEVSIKERDAYYAAANECYDMFVKAAQYVIDNRLYKELDIPTNLIEMIEMSWEDDSNLHLFGRFDFAGGLDGLPIKLLEFNADTPSSLPETALVQWAQLKTNDIDEDRQFNFVFDALKENFERLLEENEGRDPYILFSTMPDAPEDDINISILMEAAREAGFKVEFATVDNVIFSPDGIFTENHIGGYYKHEFWFKIVPWEMIGWNEPEMASILTEIMKQGQAVIINPAYTLLFQSKGILKYLWDLHPNHPLLLKTDFTAPEYHMGYVKKAILGREGSNVAIYDMMGEMAEITHGDYGDQKVIYQALATLNEDNKGNSYQAGVFFAYEGCGLGFRRNYSKIIDNAAQFIGHYTEKDKSARNRFFK